MSQEYIKKMRESGKTDSDIKKELEGAGWTKTEIAAALAEADGKLVPPPPPHAALQTPASPSATAPAAGAQSQ